MEHGKDPRLDQIFASYGADRARWPASERSLVDEGGEAAREAHEIDQLLSLASTPALPEGAASRLMQRIAEPQTAQVIAFPPAPRRTRGTLFRLATAVPLAASLALGIYLGAKGSLDFMLPSAITGGVALNDDPPDDLGGVGEADIYAEESLT